MTEMTASRPGATRLGRIARMSQIMGWLCLLAAIALPLGVAAIWLISPADYLASEAHIPAAWLRDFDWLWRVGAALVTGIPLSALVWALLRLQACFAGFERGELFAPATIAGFRDFSIGLLISAALSVPATTALSVLMSWGAPAGQKQLAISLSSDTLLMLCVAGTMAVVGWVLAEAAAIAEENASFV